jgi:hypothetical protein
MSDPTPPPDSAPAPAPSPETPAKAARRACNWHRVRVYTYSIILILTMWVCAIMLELYLHPQRMVDRALAQLPYPASTGNVHWINRRTLKIEYLKIGNFFFADSVVITASPFGLWRHHLAQVQVTGAQLFTKELALEMEKPPPHPVEQENWLSQFFDGAAAFLTGFSSNGVDWVIGRLEISRGTLMLDNLIAETAIPVGLGMAHPIVLTQLRLGKPDASPEMSLDRTVEISSVNLTSPFDPLARVLVFPLTRVTFNYLDLWHHKIARIDLIHPTMYLGEDLFWLTRELKAEKPSDSTGINAPWLISEFKVDYGRIAVSAFGQPAFHFPFFFDTKVDNIRLDQLDQISAKSSVNIQNLTEDYPDYKVRVNNLRGKLYFSWPPTNATANNVVNSIQIDDISWNDISAKAVNATVTFDPNGVYGRLTGGCEGGQLSGNFEFYYSKGFTWNADFFAQKVNCQPIAEKLAGKYCDLTGEIDGNIAVQGQATDILKCQGLLSLPSAGQLKIRSMEELLDRLPPDTIALKRDALKLVIASFDTYPYDSGKLTLNYTPAGGASVLRLDGPRGARTFQVELHPFGAPEKAVADGK